ncbi:hypothetical protein EVC45_04410 [Paraburkholderia sp. UYCP14C]|uniref:hypothetical protein n=1 Tax=Paraburkholderia sp. UYCP14C TaxID=2511130 RepID=UPI0010226ED7|nr:hypothetical protein [Paraburkholderia sp. UYCP14C]RZF31196.1 hypothetical protein EVC45_04410 [Paraburkholderia sp. UYCP14C]
MSVDPSEIIHAITEGIQKVEKESPTPLAVVVCIVVIACIALVIVWSAPIWVRLIVSIIAVGTPSMLLIYVVGKITPEPNPGPLPDPKYGVLMKLDGVLWKCLDKETNLPCKEPPSVPPGVIVDATTDVFIRLHNERSDLPYTYGKVENSATRTISNSPPDCANPLTPNPLRGDISEDGNTICWNNPTKWVKVGSLPGDNCR